MGIRKAKKLERAGQIAFPGMASSEYGHEKPEPKAKPPPKKKRGRRKGSAEPTTAPFVKGSDTSKAAADSLDEGTLNRLEAKVLYAIRKAKPRGLTDDEIEIVTELSHQSASARRRSLVLKGLVEDSGERRKTRSGRKATVWKETT